jgi:hypothetical protein
MKLLNNYEGTSHVETTYKISTNIHLSLLAPYVESFIKKHHCGLRYNHPWDTGQKMEV